MLSLKPEERLCLLKASLARVAMPEVRTLLLELAAETVTVKIRDIKTIMTAPDGIRLVIVKVETTEPGLVGWGCATFTQRALVVKTAVEEYLKPFLIGRNVDEIEDIWQSSYVSSYWRNGPVLFNAMSGVDIALWDIKAKRAGMPLYQLLGGKVRQGADCYFHASGSSFSEVEIARGAPWKRASATCACKLRRLVTPDTGRAANRLRQEPTRTRQSGRPTLEEIGSLHRTAHRAEVI